MVQTVRLTMDIPQLQYTMGDVPVELVMQVHFLVVAQRPFSSWSGLSVRPLRFRSCSTRRWSMFQLSFSGCAGGAVYIGTRPGLTAALGRGRGGGDAGACSQVSSIGTTLDRHGVFFNHPNHHHHPSVAPLLPSVCET